MQLRGWLLARRGAGRCARSRSRLRERRPVMCTYPESGFSIQFCVSMSPRSGRESRRRGLCRQAPTGGLQAETAGHVNGTQKARDDLIDRCVGSPYHAIVMKIGSHRASRRVEAGDVLLSQSPNDDRPSPRPHRVLRPLKRDAERHRSGGATAGRLGGRDQHR